MKNAAPSHLSTRVDQRPSNGIASSSPAIWSVIFRSCIFSAPVTSMARTQTAVAGVRICRSIRSLVRRRQCYSRQIRHRRISREHSCRLHSSDIPADTPTLSDHAPAVGQGCTKQNFFKTITNIKIKILFLIHTESIVILGVCTYFS